MAKTKVIRFLSLLLAIALVFASFCSPAYAISNEQFSSWLAAAMNAVNIYVNSIDIPIADAIQTISNPPSWIHENIHFTYPTMGQVIDEYMNRSVIKIRPNTITIDGVEYQDIWLSHDAAEAFRVNSYDAITAWNIASESNGTFVSGVGQLGSLPVFQNGEKIMTQYIAIQYPEQGSSTKNYYTVGGLPQFSTGRKDRVYYLNSNNVGVGTDIYWGLNAKAWYQINLNYNTVTLYANTPVEPQKQFSGGTIPFANYVPGNFQFDWVADTIQPDQPIQQEEGLLIRIPVIETNPIYQFIIDNPEFVQPGGVQIDTSITELNNKIDALLALILPFLNQSVVTYNIYEQPVPPTPTPPPTPIPTTTPPPTPTPSPEPIPTPSPSPGAGTIANEPWPSLYDLLIIIINRLETTYNLLAVDFWNFFETIRLTIASYGDQIRIAIIVLGDKIDQFFIELGDKLDQLFVNLGDTIHNESVNLGDTIHNESVDLGDKFEFSLGGITIKLQPIIDGINFIVDGINVIIDGVDNIVNNVNDLGDHIVNGDENWFDKVVDSIKNPFIPILNIIKEHVQIWHYVISWFGVITVPFDFFRTVLVGIGAPFISPIYAAVAGTIVIAIYRRFMQ